MEEAELAAWVQEAAGRPVLGMDRVGYGASRATYTVRMADPPDLVIRRDTGDGPMAGTELSLRREAQVYRALQPSAVRIPRLYAVAPDGAALLVERAEGTHELDGLSRRDVEAVLDDYMDALADLHRIDPTGLDLPDFRRPADGPSHASAELDLWEAILRSRTKRPWPLAHFTLGFLRRHAPSDVARTVLCHGDVGPGNFMHQDSRVTALLDWEFSHLGDPMDDLAWWVFRGHDMKGNCGDLRSQLQRWSTRAGVVVDARRIDYYRILVMFRWLVSVATTLDAAGGAMDRSVHFGLVPVLSVRLPAAMASYDGIPLTETWEPPTARPTAAAEVLEALAFDLDQVIRPVVSDPEAARRLAAAALYLSHLRESDARGAALAEEDHDDLAGILGRRPSDAPGGLAQAASDLVSAGAETEAIPYLWRNGLRQVCLWPLVEARATAPATRVPEGVTP